MKLKNKIALVTGASSGIGEASARALSGNGAKVILTGRNQKKLKELSEEIGGTFLTANLSISEDIINLFESIGDDLFSIQGISILQLTKFLREAGYIE